MTIQAVSEFNQMVRGNGKWYRTASTIDIRKVQVGEVYAANIDHTDSFITSLRAVFLPK